MTVTALRRGAHDFSLRLRNATRVQHERAEESGFMSALIAGELPLDGYSALAGQLWHVYSALEETAVDLRTHPVVGPFVADELFRLPALEADLAHLLGADGDPGDSGRGRLRGADPEGRPRVAGGLYRPPLHPVPR